MMRSRLLTAVLVVGLVTMVTGTVMVWPALCDLVSGRGLPDTAPPAIRPAAWAQPVNLPGVENLHRISPTLYRGAQPSEVGFRHLAEMGIKTAVNLRADHDDADELRDTELVCVHITTEPWGLRPQEVAEFLKVVTDPARQPVFFHCRQGADRTGAMAAAYRVIVEGWTKDAAIEEMTRGGYGFHRGWAGLVDVVRGLPVEDLRRRLGAADLAASRPAGQNGT
ncbi:MAG: tyrosine-protein phosphatase, partial [Phycisphaerae bacterium]|nr:tyrosine-protein phosphatase [Phycisphaerae bacterium]